MVIFVAQNPKSRNNLAYPLIGTHAGKVLDQWRKLLGDPRCLVIYASKEIGKITYIDYDLLGMERTILRVKATRFVALGEYASGALERLGRKHFILPQPSVSKRDLKEKESLAKQLELCRLYIQSSKG